MGAASVCQLPFRRHAAVILLLLAEAAATVVIDYRGTDLADGFTLRPLGVKPAC
jgi:hypothetical protein